MFTLNRLKLDHINFKDSNYIQLDKNTKWTVKRETECNLGKWIVEQERENKSYTKTSNWNRLKEVHVNVHKGVQNIIDNNADKNISVMLDDTLDIDKSISEVFSAIQQVKRDNCKDFIQSQEKVEVKK
jgi:methyl-accepting chemotaxis protein